MKLMSYTPLRYPGGKAKIYNKVKKLIENNFIEKPAYCEAFAGGSGLALKLLMTNVVKEIHLNDLDEAIYSFWYSIINHNDELINLIETTSVDIGTWSIQKDIYLNPNGHTVLEKGFATFFLNRTNRSGIMTAGPIGGKNQTGNYKMDARYNIDKLTHLIRLIGTFKDRIFIYNYDAKVFLEEVDNNLKDAIFYLDPPYVTKGPKLYKNSFTLQDHEDLSEKVMGLKNKWFITYDNHTVIENLYANYTMHKFELSYSVETKRKGIEISIFSNELQLNF